MTEKNAMEELAKASFYVTDAVKGLVGEWKIEDTDWTVESSRRLYTEMAENLQLLKEAGFKDRPSIAERAPFTHNIRCGCFYKRFPDGPRWITLRVAERFGFDAKFEVHTKMPWSD